MGEPKQASIDCDVKKVSLRGAGDSPTDFGHLCESRGGSAGSPVLDRRTGQVVGLHHLGMLPGSSDSVKQAVHIGFVLDDLKRRFPVLHAEITAAHP